MTRTVCRAVALALCLTSAAAPAAAAQRTRKLCGWCAYDYDCGQALQPTCDTGTACDPGFLVYDAPNETVDCPGICGPDEVITHACYDPANPPSCDLCGGDGELPCPGGGGCTPGCEPGTALAGGVCYSDCGGAGDFPCPNGACQDGIESQAGLCVNCGGNNEPECLFGAACRYGTRSVGLIASGLWRACGYCGGTPGPGGEKASVACEGAVCDPGYLHVTADGLSGSIAACDEFFSGAEQIHFVNQNGICSPGFPETMSRPAPESWPAADPPDGGRGTLIVIHGRGAACDNPRDRMLDAGGLYATNHLVYCVEYAQEGVAGVDRRAVKIVPVRDDLLGRPHPPCTASQTCEFDQGRPLAETLAPSFTVSGVAQALYEALLQVPTVGEITLLPHSQGGFIARQLVYRHYDDLRWHGRKIARVVTLGHPFYAKQVDPHLYTPWLCADRDDFDCATGRWTWGWSLNALDASGGIDNTDYPQIDWTAVSGDGPPGSTAPEPEGDDCLEIFGGVPRSIVAGDTSVPIQSSLGYEEFGFPFQVAALNLDRRYHTTCEHTAFCMLTETLPGETACVPASSPPPPPADACWGTDPVPALLPAADPLPLPTTLGFDGTSQVAVTTAAAQSALTMTSAQTLEAWIRPEGTGQDATFLAKEGEYQIGVKPNAGKSVLAWSLANASPGWFWTYTGFEPPAHLWTHVALTYNGSSVVIYANGVPIQITAASGAIGDVGPTQNELRIGGRQAVPAAFRGQMDDVRIWSRALSRSEVIAGLGGLPGAGNTAGLAAWWRFDEGYGDLIRDEGPNGIDLALSTLGPGLAPVRRGDPPEAGPGGALLFDGVDDFVAVSDPAPLAPLDMNTALTIEAWIYPRNPSSGTGGVIVNKEGEYALTRWGDGRITFSIANTSPGWVSVHGTYVAPAHAWTHVAFVYDAAAAQARLYIDGALHQTWAASGTIGDAVPTQNELRIGGRQAAPTSQPFRGVIDEVRIWNRARTTAEIAAEFDRVIVDPAQATGLVGYWRFDEAAGGVAFDLAADGHASLGNTGPQFAPERNLAPHLPGQTLIYPTCGDGSTDPGETCDDGGTAGGDGCSPACRQETLFRLYGTPQGGTVTLVVEGVSIEVTILPGQMLAEVMATIALAIQSHPVLAAMRIAASTEGDDLIIGGSYSGVVVADPGLTDCTNGPALPFVAGGASNTCPETTVALSTGAYASYQWHRDGVPVAGATAASYDATLSGDYGVEVRDALGCPAVSSNVAVQVWFCPESEVSPRGAIFPLRIEASPQSSTGYYVYFQSLEGAIGYNLYSGLLPGPVDHAGSPVNVCDLVVADLGTGELRAELLLPDGDAGYVLIGAFDGGSEGIAHRDSDGVPIDPSQATCPP